MSDISVKFLRKETRDLISALLNPKKVIPNERGLNRDWHGLAELCGFGGEMIRSFEDAKDPTLKVLEIWTDKEREESTTAKLLSFLETLDRFDVVQDIIPLIEKDAEYHAAHPEGFKVDLPDIDDKDIITYDDAERKRLGLPPQTYDAFVLYDDDDIGFATDIINTLEGQYNMNLCVKERDVVAGEFYFDSVIRLITNRCKRVVVVVSPSFLESPCNKYFYTLARIDGLERQERKIIPCLYKKCLELPLEIRGYHLLDYTRAEKTFGNFWDQLYKSVKVVIPPSNRSTTQHRETNVVTQKKPTRYTKSTNHVKFGIVEQPKIIELPKLENPPPAEEEFSAEKSVSTPPTSSIPLTPPAPLTTATPSTPPTLSTLEPNQTQLKKKNSFYQKIRKILHQDNNKDDKVEEVPQINGSAAKKKKKNFWKRNKFKLAVAN